MYQELAAFALITQPSAAQTLSTRLAVALERARFELVFTARTRKQPHARFVQCAICLVITRVGVVGVVDAVVTIAGVAVRNAVEQRVEHGDERAIVVFRARARVVDEWFRRSRRRRRSRRGRRVRRRQCVRRWHCSIHDHDDDDWGACVEQGT